MMRQITVGLTGSIGMGKSTVAGYFADLGVNVWDADEAVHQLYSKGGAGSAAISDIVPDAVVEGAVDRRILAQEIQNDAALLPKIEAAIHPLVAQDRKKFVENHPKSILLFDIPLLFEGNLEHEFDYIIVVSASPDIQRKRVLARPGMSAEKLDFILSKQIPDAVKRERADYIIETTGSFDDTRQQVANALQEIVSK